jgi:hypothetical protein
MRKQGHMIAEAALKHRRSKLLGEIFVLNRQIRNKRTQIAHLDATLKMFDPDYESGSMKAKRYHRPPMFGHGELGRAILSVMRESDGEPLAAFEIADRVRTRLGVPDDAKMAVTSRVRSNLTYLHRHRKMVQKIGRFRDARWALVKERIVSE